MDEKRKNGSPAAEKDKGKSPSKEGRHSRTESKTDGFKKPGTPNGKQTVPSAGSSSAGNGVETVGVNPSQFDILFSELKSISSMAAFQSTKINELATKADGLATQMDANVRKFKFSKLKI